MNEEMELVSGIRNAIDDPYSYWDTVKNDIVEPDLLIKRLKRLVSIKHGVSMYSSGTNVTEDDIVMCCSLIVLVLGWNAFSRRLNNNTVALGESIVAIVHRRKYIRYGTLAPHLEVLKIIIQHEALHNLPSAYVKSVDNVIALFGINMNTLPPLSKVYFEEARDFPVVLH